MRCKSCARTVQLFWIRPLSMKFTLIRPFRSNIFQRWRSHQRKDAASKPPRTEWDVQFSVHLRYHFIERLREAEGRKRERAGQAGEILRLKWPKGIVGVNFLLLDAV